MSVPDVRRLLQLVLAVAAPRDRLAQGLRLSAWRQARNRRARAAHAKTRRRKQLRDTG